MLIGNTMLVQVAGVDQSEWYDWERMDILFDPETKTYYLYQDSGCSCSYPYENVDSLEDLTKLEGRFDALARVTYYIQTSKGYFDFDSVVALGEIEKLANFKEESA